jgi:hypothetical protein
MKPGFKYHKRKIDVFCRTPNGGWRYVWSTNAYPTCRAAAEAAAQKAPAERFKAWFAK